MTAEPETVPVHVAWSRVQRDVQSIAKAERNTQQNFNFRGVDATMMAVGPRLREHGVFVLPFEILDVQAERYESRQGAAMRNVTLTIRWEITGPAGDVKYAMTVGEAADVADKAVSKAHSVAYRTLFLQGLCIPTGDPDPDSQVHERASAPPVDPRAALWAEVRQAREARGWSSDDVAADFVGWSEGTALGEADADQLTRYVQHLRSVTA